MTKIKLCWLLLLVSMLADAQFDRPEWQLVVPDKMTSTPAGLAGPNQPILVDRNGEVSLFILDDYLPFDVPDTTVITSISFKESDDEDAILLISFSTDVADFMLGDVLQCQSQLCHVVFNPQTDLGTADVVQVDALSSVDSSKVHLSFNAGFNFNGLHVDPNWIYSYSTNSQGDVSLVGQANATGLGFTEVTSLNAFDFNRDAIGISRFFGGNTDFISSGSDLIGAGQILAFINNTTFFGLPFNLPAGVERVNAYSALNSGFAGFSVALLDVQESAGELIVEVTRNQGAENFMQVVVEDLPMSAQNGVDYSFSPIILSWLDGESDSKQLSIPIIDNQQIDGDKFFTLNLFAASEFAAVEPFQSVTTVTVLDDEASDLIFKDGFE